MRLDLVIGPNGAGKSTFVRLAVAPRWPAAVFVNADVIAARRWPEDPQGHSYEAARLAEATRAQLIVQGHPFIAETVASHPSKLDLIHAAHAAGFYVALHVLMVPEDLAVARVAARVAAGGHDVPETKIRQRHRRLWAIAADAAAAADTATFWDNSRYDGPRQAALLAGGMPVGRPTWPTWAPDELAERWPAR